MYLNIILKIKIHESWYFNKIRFEVSKLHFMPRAIITVEILIIP